jgi:hypothetical protein
MQNKIRIKIKMRSSPPIRHTTLYFELYLCNHIPLTCYVSDKSCITKNNAWFKIFVIRLLINTIYSCNSQHGLGNFDQDDQKIYHDITDPSEISTADDNISDIDNAEDNGFNLI